MTLRLTSSSGGLPGVQGSVGPNAHVCGWRLRQVVPVRYEERKSTRMRPRESHFAGLRMKKSESV